MSLTVTEAQAVSDLLAALDPGSRAGDAPTDERLMAAIELLAARAHKTLMAGPAWRPQRIVDRLAGVDSDGDAQAVCRAIAVHLGHGGSLPWPSIRQPFDAWQASNARAQAGVL